MKRTLALLLLLALTLAVFSVCGKNKSDPGEVAEYELPTKLTRALTMDGEKVSVTETVEFAKNQLSVTYDSETYTGLGKTIYLLDEYGNIVRKVDYDGSGNAANSADYVYDGDGRRTRGVMDVHLTGSMIYSYNVYTYSGDRVAVRDYILGTGEPQELTMKYDKNGRLVQVGHQEEAITYEYDQYGHIASRGHGGERSEFELAYDDSGRLTGMVGELDRTELNLSFGDYKTFQMTEGQYRCALLLLAMEDTEMYRGKSAGDSEKICYADGTPLKTCSYSDDGRLLTETFYLPDKEVEYTVRYSYDDGKLSGALYEDAKGKELLALSFDADGNPVVPYDGQG